MGNRVLVKTGGFFLIALGTLVPMEAKAYPFEPTPEGFTQYLNQIRNWDGGSNYSFFKPRECENIDAVPKVASYVCKFDYLENSSLGIRTCINRSVEYGIYYGRVYLRSSGYECNDWEKVSAPPESPPPPEPEAPPAPQPTPHTNQPVSSQANCDKFPSPIGIPYFMIGFVSATVIAMIGEAFRRR